MPAELSEAVVIQLAAEIVRSEVLKIGDRITEAEALAIAREMHRLFMKKRPAGLGELTGRS